jgi:hypothetical protein
MHKGFWWENWKKSGLQQPSCTQEEKIKKIRWNGVDCIHLAQDMDQVCSCERGNKCSGSIICKGFPG